jgi:hypothetical protein
MVLSDTMILIVRFNKYGLTASDIIDYDEY